MGKDNQNMNAIFAELERIAPGSVRLDEEGSAVTLIGWHLVELDPAQNNQDETNKIKTVTQNGCVSQASRNFRLNAIKRAKQNSFLVGVVNPLTNTPKENASGKHCCCTCGICGEKACTIQQEYKGTSNDQHLIPVIKGKFCERVIHFLSSLFGR